MVTSSLSGPSLIVDQRNAGPAMPDRVYVRTDSAASRAAVLAAVRSQHARVVPVSAWSAAVTDKQAEQNQVGLELLLGIAIAYSAIGIGEHRPDVRPAALGQSWHCCTRPAPSAARSYGSPRPNPWCSR